jgi:transaldolase
MTDVRALRVKLFADGADLAGIRRLAARPEIQGFTTNPTLMRQAGVADYAAFAQQVIAAAGARAVSFEVLADDFEEMEREARAIAAWGPHVNVKIPVTNTRGEFCGPVIERLAGTGICVNVTAITTLEQVRRVAARLSADTAAIVSVMAGRIADTGRDPVPIMAEAVSLLRSRSRAELLWASTREVLNVFQADAVGCHIITATSDVLQKLPLAGKDLDDYSLETVKMFHRDARAAAYDIPGRPLGTRS